MKPYRPEKVFIERSARDLPGAGEIVSRLPGVPVEEVEDMAGLAKSLRERPDPLGEGKRSLFLRRDLGRAFKPFPVPEGTISCEFYSLHLVEGCDLECSYCILQAYLTNPLLTVYVNTEEILQNLEDFLKSRPQENFRIGTGQLADSLSLDHLTAHSEQLVPFFARQKNSVLEFKTKSVNIARLEKLDPAGKAIVSWSMNTPKIQREEEHKCASIKERIEAAKKVAAWGYRVGFHFDPLIDYEECLEEYEAVLEEILSAVPQEKIAWVSFGSLRFMPALKSIMENRFPKSPLPYAEWTRGPDGKMRYYKERRIELYSGLVKFLMQNAPEVPSYLCMETEEVWQRVFGKSQDPKRIAARLNEAALACRTQL